MAELFIGLGAFIICLITPVVALTALFTSWVIRRRGPGSATPPAEAPDPLRLVELAVSRWAAHGRLDRDVAAQIYQLIAQDRRLAAGEALAAPPATAGEAQQALAIQAPAAAAAPAPPAPTEPAEPSGPPALVAALLSLGTRRALLFLGAFLLVVSSLVLVVFNWASFPPIIQLGLLVGVTGGIWAGGAWMLRRPDLAVAGRNLQAVAALLVPVVGFAMARPGLLNLAAREAWLLASALSLLLYLLAAWRSGRAFYSGAAAAASVSTLLAALNPLPLGWQPALLAPIFPLMQLVAHRLRQSPLAAGPRWVAHLGLPLSLAGAALLGGSPLDSAPLAVALLVGALAYALQTWIDRRPHWLWAAAALAVVAQTVGAAAAALDPTAQALARAALGLAYFLAGVYLERDRLPFARPFFALAALLGLVVFGESTTARIITSSYPLLIAGLLGAVLLIGRGRLAWLGANKNLTSGLALGGAALLLAGWLFAALTLADVALNIRGLLLLPLAALALAGARWWPGRLARHYDLALHLAGALISLAGGALAMTDGDTMLEGAALLALIWSGQAALRRSSIWAAAGLGAAYLAGVFALDRADLLGTMTPPLLLSLGVAALYAIGGGWLRHGPLRYWSLPATAWAIPIGLFGLFLVGARLVNAGQARPLDVVALLSMAALFGVLTWLWRQAWLGGPAAALGIVAVILAGERGFFSGWQPAFADLAYVAVALAFGLALGGLALRRFGRAYAWPYELAAAILLPLAPLFALGERPQLTISFLLVAGLYGLAVWRYSALWPLAPALLALDLGLLHGAAWLLPGGSPAGAAWVLALAVVAQALGGLAARRLAGGSFIQGAGVRAYIAAAIGAAGALALALGDMAALAGIAGILAAVLALLATAEQEEPAAWGALGMLLISLTALHTQLGLTPAWGLAWLVLELLGVVLAGWVATRLGLGLWARPTLLLPLGAGGMALAFLASMATFGGLPALTFGLASAGLLLTTVAVRQRQVAYAYAAGAAFVGAVLCQLVEWGFREPQLYALPAGIYLLVLAHGLRGFRQRPAAQLTEAVAVVLLLGTTFGQALQASGGFGHLLLLCAEALVVAGYGALARLRAPFGGGVAFFVVGVGWMALNAARFTNQWVLLGALGLLMVAAYVLLERHQERLVRAGRQWAAQLRSWG